MRRGFWIFNFFCRSVLLFRQCWVLNCHVYHILNVRRNVLLVISPLVLRPTWSKPLNDKKHVRDQEKKLNYFKEVKDGWWEISAKSFEVKLFALLQVLAVGTWSSMHVASHLRNLDLAIRYDAQFAKLLIFLSVLILYFKNHLPFGHPFGKGKRIPLTILREDLVGPLWKQSGHAMMNAVAYRFRPKRFCLADKNNGFEFLNFPCWES